MGEESADNNKEGEDEGGGDNNEEGEGVDNEDDEGADNNEDGETTNNEEDDDVSNGEDTAYAIKTAKGPSVILVHKHKGNKKETSKNRKRQKVKVAETCE